MRTIAIFGAAAALMALAACESGPKAPTDQGVCYNVVNPTDKETIDFVVVARDQATIEQCAARLEEVRQRFRRMGMGADEEVVGTYQGRFMFVDRGGVWTAKSLTGGRYFLLARSGDGRLVVSGAIEHPPETQPPAQ